MSVFLLIPFLIACLLGSWVAWRLPLEAAPAFVPLVLMVATAGAAGALTVAAEAGSAAARYLGLAAVLLGTGALSGIFFAIRRAGRPKRVRDRP